MEITLNLDSIQVKDSVIEILNSLTPTQKNELAYKVVSKWFEEPFDLEKDYIIEKKAQDWLLNRTKNNYYKEKFKNIDEVKLDYDFQREIKNIETPKDKMLEMLQKDTLAYYKTKIDEIFKTPEFIKKLEDQFENYAKQFPNLILKSLAQAFTENFDLMSALKYKIMDEAH